MLLGLGTAMVYPTLLAAIGDVAQPVWRARAVGVYRLWRDGGFAAGALLAGLIADLWGLTTAVWVVAALTAGSGLVVVARMYETHSRSGPRPLIAVSSHRLDGCRQPPRRPFPWDPGQMVTGTHHTGPVMRIGVLEQARASFAKRSWGDAYAQFATADTATPLGLDDLEKLALAAYLTGHEEESTLAWTRAHHEAIRRDDPQRAARNAFLIGSGLMFRGETAPGMGWFARGGRVLEGCGECAEQAWPRTWNAFAQMWGGDAEGAQPVFAESAMVGQRFNDADLLTMSRLGQGMCLVMQGQGPAGIGSAGRGHGRGHVG